MPFPYLIPFPLGEDTLPPVITNIDPASGATLATLDASVSFDVSDVVGQVGYVIVMASFSDRPSQFVCYGDPGGTFTFSDPYTGLVSTISNGFTIGITAGGEGWGENPTLDFFALDNFGNPMPFGTTTASYTFSPTPPDSPPTITNITPAPGETLGRFDPIEFDTQDDVGFRRIVLNAKFALLGTWEIIHDGTGFGPTFANESVRTPISDGYHFSILRNGGWPEPPSIEISPIDVIGQEPA